MQPAKGNCLPSTFPWLWGFSSLSALGYGRAEDEKEAERFWAGECYWGVFWVMWTENWQPACVRDGPWEVLSWGSCVVGSLGGETGELTFLRGVPHLGNPLSHHRSTRSAPQTLSSPQNSISAAGRHPPLLSSMGRTTGMTALVLPHGWMDGFSILASLL